MAHRTVPNGTADELQPVLPAAGAYQPVGPGAEHRHGDGRVELHADGDRPHYHDDDSGILVWLDVDATQPIVDAAAATVDLAGPVQAVALLVNVPAAEELLPDADLRLDGLDAIVEQFADNRVWWRTHQLDVAVEGFNAEADRLGAAMATLDELLAHQGTYLDFADAAAARGLATPAAAYCYAGDRFAGDGGPA